MLLTEQPDNEFGSLAVTLTWLSNTYQPYPSYLWDTALQLARDYNNPDEGVLQDGTQSVIGQYVVCAAYHAILADPNGVNLSPDFAENFALILSEFVSDLTGNAEGLLAVPFTSRIINMITLAKFKRVAFEASTADPSEMGDYDCDCSWIDPPVTGDCVEESRVWLSVGATPSEWSQIGATLPTVDLGTLNDDAANIPNFNASRTAFGNWINPGVAGVQGIGIKRVFAEPCTLNHVGYAVQSDTLNTKWWAIYVKIGATYTMINSHFAGAPAGADFGGSWTGTLEDVEEVHFIAGSGNIDGNINMRIRGCSINTPLVLP